MNSGRIVIPAAFAATLLLLAACAGHRAPGSGEETAAAVPAGHRASTRNGEQVFCKRELLTGSRTQSVETCLTAAQIEQQRSAVDALMRRAQDARTGGAGADGSGGRFNNVMTSGGRAGGQ